MKILPLIALDIGATKVACAIGLPHGHAPGFELLGCSLVAYPLLSETWLADPLMVSRTIEQAINATAVSGDFDRTLVGVNHPALVSERVRVGIALGDEPMAVRAQDLDRLQASALHQVLGVDRESLLVERLSCTGNGFDGVRDPRGLTATRLVGLFHILTIPLAARRALIQAVESAGLEVAHLSFTLPAALASVAETTLAPPRVLFIDVGGLATDVGLFVDGMLHVAQVLPWGGLTLASTIAKELRVTMDQALTWSLEGTACRKVEVRRLVEQRWASLEGPIQTLLKGQPHPDATLVGGRGALMDGFAEWLERSTGMTSRICRSPRTSQLGDLSRQVGLSAAIGLLELATCSFHEPTIRSSHLFNRVIDRTKTILTEYF